MIPFYKFKFYIHREIFLSIFVFKNNKNFCLIMSLFVLLSCYFFLNKNNKDQHILNNQGII